MGAAIAFVEELRRTERITDLDQARVTAFLTLAKAVDDDPTNAQLRREYRMAESALRATEDNDSAAFASVIAALSAPVRDPAVP